MVKKQKYLLNLQGGVYSNDNRLTIPKANPELLKMTSPQMYNYMYGNQGNNTNPNITTPDNTESLGVRSEPVNEQKVYPLNSPIQAQPTDTLPNRVQLLPAQIATNHIPDIKTKKHLTLKD